MATGEIAKLQTIVDEMLKRRKQWITVNRICYHSFLFLAVISSIFGSLTALLGEYRFVAAGAAVLPAILLTIEQRFDFKRQLDWSEEYVAELDDLDVQLSKPDADGDALRGKLRALRKRLDGAKVIPTVQGGKMDTQTNAADSTRSPQQTDVTTGDAEQPEK